MLNNEKKSKKNHDKIALINHGSFKKLINNCSKWHQSKLCHFKMLQPHNRECSAIGIPKKMAQMIFSKKLPSPPPYVTSFPNGKSASPANLKHCMPTGIPTMVMHQIHPAIKYPRALTRPPQSIHIIFPRKPIKFSFLSYTNLRREYTFFVRKSRLSAVRGTTYNMIICI